MIQPARRTRSTHPCVKMGLCVALWLLHLGLVNGCGTAKVVHVESDAAFNFSSAATGEVAIAGFATNFAAEDQQAALERNLPPVLAASIQKKWPEIKILSPERVQLAVGPESYQVLLHSYGEMGALDSLDLDLLSTSMQDLVQYVIMGRVESDLVTRFEEDYADSTQSGTKYHTRREASVTLEVYDLRTRASVFRTVIENDKTNTRDSPDITSGDADSFSEACGNMLMSCTWNALTSLFQGDSDDDGYPVPPTTAELMEDVFDKFADSLPKAKEG